MRAVAGIWDLYTVKQIFVVAEPQQPGLPNSDIRVSRYAVDLLRYEERTLDVCDMFDIVQLHRWLA